MARKTETATEAQEQPLSREEIKALRKAASDEIIGGANPCPDCDNLPHGMKHDENSVKPFEVGCLVCRDHRVRANSPAEAVAKWNAGEYMPPQPAAATATPPPE